MAAEARRKVVVLPPIAWLPARREHRPDLGPDLASLERGLAAHGVDAVILDPMRRPWNPLHGRGPVLQGIDPLRALRVLLFHRHVDAVLCVFEGPALVLAVLRGIMRFRPKVVMWDLILGGGWRLRSRMQDVIVPRVDEIVVLGSNQVAAIDGQWARHAPVRCVGHYLDTAFWRPMPVPKAGYALAVGDDHSRDYGLLLEAAGGLECEVVIRSGKELPLDTVRHRRVRQLRPRMAFTGLRDLYAGASVVVVPLHDGPTAGGVSALHEALAMGCAVVASDSAGIRDWLRDGKTCLVVPCGDAAAMGAAIQRLLGDPALRERLGAAARAYMLEACTPDAFAARLAARLTSGHLATSARQRTN